MRRIAIALLTLLVVFVAVAACGGPSTPETYGPEVTNPKDYKSATVEEVFSNPELMDKLVVIDCYFDNICPAGCWFFIKDAPDSTTKLYCSRNKDAFTIPQSLQGKHAKVWGKVSADNTQEILEAHRVEIIQ